MKPMKRSEVKIGLKVRTLREFSGVPKGTEGVIERIDKMGFGMQERDAIGVHWNRKLGDKLIDWFNERELKFLEIVK